jgi:transcriptional regulator of NAD metabolism
MQEVPAVAVVRGVIVSHEAAVEAVQVPVPEVRMEPPPPSLVKVRVGGSIVIWANAEEVLSTSRTKNLMWLMYLVMVMRAEIESIVV